MCMLIEGRAYWCRDVRDSKEDLRKQSKPMYYLIGSFVKLPALSFWLTKLGKGRESLEFNVYFDSMWVYQSVFKIVACGL